MASAPIARRRPGAFHKVLSGWLVTGFRTHARRVKTRPSRCRPPIVLALAALLLVVPTCLRTASHAWADEASPPAVTLLLPVPGAVLHGFEAPLTEWGAGHRGVDLAASPGDPVRAAAAGTVSFAGMVAGRPVLTIDHGNGVDTTYEPVRSVVATGQRVAAGQLVGALDTGGHAPGLHWGLRRGARYFDPMLHLVGGPSGEIRLLPLDAVPHPLAAALPAHSGGALSSVGGGIPVSGPVTSPYGMRLHPLLKVWKLHDGVDFGAPCGAPIRSVGAGTVVLVDHHVAYGRRVVVDVGGGRRHGYTHLGTTSVRVGQRVPAGAHVGAVGSTGYSTGCHLHFMAWQDGRVVPPL